MVEVRALAGCFLLAAATLAAPAGAQHGDHSTPATPPSPGGGHQGHSGESGPAMLWQMYMDLGSQAYRFGLWNEAEKTFTSAVKEARTLGANDPRLATALNYLGELYRVQGRLPAAEQALQEALAIREKALGPDSVAVAETVNNLALTRQAMGRPAEARTLLRRALAI